MLILPKGKVALISDIESYHFRDRSELWQKKKKHFKKAPSKEKKHIFSKNKKHPFHKQKPLLEQKIKST